jgi:hypothetical protein
VVAVALINSPWQTGRATEASPGFSASPVPAGCTPGSSGDVEVLAPFRARPRGTLRRQTMKTKSLAVLVAAMVLLAPTLASAQVIFAPYETTFSEDIVGLLSKEQVRQELKLKKEEAAKLGEALRPIKEKYQTEVKSLQKLPAKEAQEKYTDFRKTILAESHKVIAATLRPEQMKRLKQIEFQQRGPKAFDDPDVQKLLALREDQKAKIKQVADEARQEEERALRTTGLSYQVMQRIRQQQLEKTVAVLTKEQVKTWQELVGVPFTLRPGPK